MKVFNLSIVMIITNPLYMVNVHLALRILQGYFKTNIEFRNRCDLKQIHLVMVRKSISGSILNGNKPY